MFPPPWKPPPEGITACRRSLDAFSSLRISHLFMENWGGCARIAHMARTPIVDPIAQRIRERRTELGLSLAQASARAGLKAPSFLHHIERGERLPSEQVVTWLAAALQDDEELLRAWVRLRRGAPLDLALAAAKLFERHLASGDLRSLTVEITPSTNGAPATNGDGAAA